MARSPLFRGKIKQSRRSAPTRLLCTALEAREVPTVSFLADVAPSPAVENQTAAALPSVTLNGFVYFVGNKADSGTELWRSNGADGSAELVVDLTPGAGSTDIRKIVVAGSRVLFAADPIDNVAGARLYATDGTSAGTFALAGDTVFVSNSDPNVSISTVTDLTANGEYAYWGGFAKNPDDSFRVTPYQTRVKPDGAIQNSLLGGPEAIDQAANFVALDGRTVFTATTTSSGIGLYTTDAFTTGFLSSTTAFRPFQNLVRVGDVAMGLQPQDDQFSDFRLVSTNGNSVSFVAMPNDTKLLGGLVAIGDRAYFTARNPDGTDELWTVTSNDLAPVRLQTGLNPESPGPTLKLPRTDGGKLYFSASDGIHGYEMWVSDGTPAGTKMIADLNPGSGDSVDQYYAVSGGVIPQPGPSNFAYFYAQPGGSGSAALYRTDGTANGTFPVETGDSVANFAVTSDFYAGGTNALALFRSGDANGPDLWKADPITPHANATSTSLVSIVSYSTATNKFTVDVQATVTSSFGTPAGVVRFNLGGGSDILERTLVNGVATVGNILLDSEFINLLNGNPPIYSATFIPDRVDQYETSSVTGSQFRISPDLLSVDKPTFSPHSIAEVGSQLTTTTGIHTSLLVSQIDIDSLKVRYDVTGPSGNISVNNLSIVDGIARFTDVVFLPLGDYTLRAVVLKDSTVIAESDVATFKVIPQAPATTTTTLSADVSLVFFPEIGANISLSASVLASRGSPSGTVHVSLGAVTREIPIANGSGSAVDPVFFTQEQLLSFFSSTPPAFGSTFLPDNSSFESSVASGANVKLPEGIVTIDQPIWNLERITTGTTIAISSHVSNTLGLSLSGLKVIFEARDQNGGKYPIGSADLVDGVATTSVVVTPPPGSYKIYSILTASPTVTLGESSGKPFPVLNTFNPGNPPATGRQFRLFSASNSEPTQIVWLSFDGQTSILDVGSPYSILTPPRFSATEFGYDANQTETVKVQILNKVRSLFGNLNIELTLTKPDLPEYLYSTVAIGGTPQMRYNTVNPAVATQFGTANPTFADVTGERFATGIAQTVDIGNLNQYDGAVVFSRQIAMNYLNESTGYVLDALSNQTALVIAHEIGHLLGLRHEDYESNTTTVMASIVGPISLNAGFQNTNIPLSESWPGNIAEQNARVVLSGIVGEHGAGIIGEHGAGIIGEHGAGLIGEHGAGLVGQDGASFGYSEPMFNPVVTMYGVGGRNFDGGKSSSLSFRVPGGTSTLPFNIPNLFPNAKFSIMGSSTPNGPIDMFSGTPVNGVLTPDQLQVPLFDANGNLNTAIPMAKGTMGQLQSAGTASLTSRIGFQTSQPIDTRTVFAIGAGPGAEPVVVLVDARTNREYFRLLAYEKTFTGGVQVAAADLNGDGMADLVIGSGVGGGPRVRVINGATGSQMSGPLGDSFVYEPSFRGGVQVAVGDVTGDGTPDLIIGSGVGGGPRVRVLNGQTGEAVYDFFAYEDSFRGGVQVSVADVDGDGRADILAGSGFGGGPRVRVFSGKDLHEISNFFAYEDSFRGGVNVTAGDFDGDGKVEVLAGSGIGGGPAIKLFDPLTAAPISGRFVFDDTQRSGVRVSAVRTSDTGPSRVVVSSGVGSAPRVKVLDPLTGQSLLDELAFNASFTGGVFVG
ncbi:MAG: ELWxxDGT repeat protein [Gemmataceae bacterium]